MGIALFYMAAFYVAAWKSCSVPIPVLLMLSALGFIVGVKFFMLSLFGIAWGVLAIRQIFFCQ